MKLTKRSNINDWRPCLTPLEANELTAIEAEIHNIRRRGQDLSKAKHKIRSRAVMRLIYQKRKFPE